jgi:hypothetical protein
MRATTWGVPLAAVAAVAAASRTIGARRRMRFTSSKLEPLAARC